MRISEEKSANLSLQLTVSKQELKASQSDHSFIRETMRESHEVESKIRSSLEYCIYTLEDERDILIKSHNDKNEQLKLEVFKEQIKREKLAYTLHKSEKIQKHDIINKLLNKNFHKSNRDNSFLTTMTCHKIPITSTKKMVCSNISKGSNDNIILTTEGWEENDVIRNKEKQSPICNVEHNNKMSMVYMQSHECKSNTNESPASTTFQAINKSCSNNSVRIRDSTPDKELTYIECDNSFRSSSCSLGSARKSWSQIVLPTSLLPTNDFSIPPFSSLRMVPSPCNNRCYHKNDSKALKFRLWILIIQKNEECSQILLGNL